MISANKLRLRQMRHNASRARHKLAISRRPKGKRMVKEFIKPVFVDMDKKEPKVIKEKPGVFKKLWARMTGK